MQELACQISAHRIFEENHAKYLFGTSLFCPEASVHQPNQVKPTLLSHLFWTGLSGGSCYFGVIFDPLSAVFGKICFFLFALLSPPTRISSDGSARQPPW
jgi:hypothetical protein